MEHHKQRKKVHSVKQVPTLLVNNENLKDQTDMANALNNFFIINTEKTKHSTNTERRCSLNSKTFISWKLFPANK